MDARNKRLFNIIIFSSLILTLGVTILTNLHNWWKLVPLSALLLFSFMLRRKPFSGGRVSDILVKLSFVFDLAILYLISLSDMLRVATLYFFIDIIDMVLFYPIKQSLVISVVIYLEYIAIRFVRYIKWNYFDFAYFSPALYEDILYFVFVFLIMYIAKQQIIQKQMLSQTMRQLEERTRQYGETNQKLQETLTKLEEMTTLKERNRIAREIHDTVGHTLTTVLIEIEAGKRLVPKDPSLALQKLELAQDQVRKGLNDIRHSVRTLKDGSDLLSPIPSMKSLIRDTELHAGVDIAFSYDSDLPLGEVQGRVLFSALQEGLTNGIRHGGCTSFEVSLNAQEDYIVFCIRDNGRGSSEVLVVVLTTFDDDEHIIQALNYGASGYLLKDIPGDRLIQAVRDAVSGSLLMPAQVAAKLACRLSDLSGNLRGKGYGADREQTLSTREVEIARLMVSGASNREIADTLCLTEGTVKNYISSIYSKFGTNDRSQVNFIPLEDMSGQKKGSCCPWTPGPPQRQQEPVNMPITRRMTQPCAFLI